MLCKNAKASDVSAWMLDLGLPYIPSFGCPLIILDDQTTKLIIKLTCDL